MAEDGFIKKYGTEITILIALLGLLGINFNIPKVYSGLSLDAKIFTMFFLNLLITLYLFNQKK